MTRAVLSSSLATSLKRYGRSKALWLMLLAAPVASRYMISQREGEGVSITIGSQLPVLTSAVLGVWLGIVVSTMVMPVVYIYLRANTTRRQPWQVEEVTAASRVAIALGRFFADCAVLLTMLAMLSLAGLFLGWLMVTGPWDPFAIIGCLWVVAAPTFMVVAAIRILFDAVPWLRGALGDFAFFVFWISSIIIPSTLADAPASLAVSMADVAGAIRPLVEGAPPGSDSFAIGTSRIDPGRVTLDVAKGMAASGYLASRFIWALLAIGIAAFAGLIYRPHRTKVRRRLFAWLSRVSAANLLPRAKPDSTPAGASAMALPQLVGTEMRLIASGSLFIVLALAAAAAGLADDFRHVGSPAGLLLLVFALSAHAGRSEARGLLHLTQTAVIGPMQRRAAFVAAGTCLALLLAIPAAVATASLVPVQLALITGAVGSALAIALAAITGSPFVSRLLLMFVWYGYFAS